ncbi:MAG: hypothetical protein KUG53_00405, partial [Pseudomonadales bacterium]|nr:hypothetical protein [Pseudomonadales bacterium]
MLNWDDPLAPPVSPSVAPKTSDLNKQNEINGASSKPVETIKQAAVNQVENDKETPKPVNVEDKRVVNGLTDINQLAPFKYPWAWNYFLNANKNHWTPLDINMAQDLHDYQ